MLALIAAALLAAAAGPGSNSPDSPSPAVVMIARPGDANPVLDETTVRLRAELAAAGYGSRVATCPADPLSGGVACPRDTSLATIALARANGTTTIFVTSKLRSGVELRRQVRVQAEDGGGDATLLAVRAVELLRDLQLEVAQVANDDEDPKPVEPFQDGARSTGSRWYLWGGAALLFVPWTTARAFGVAPGAVVGLGMRLNEQAMIIADVAGPFAAWLPIGSTDPSGAVTPRSIYEAVARLALRLGAQSAVQGFFSSFFIGASYTYVQLDPSVSYGSVGTAVAPMVGFGPGYTVRITPRLLVSTDIEVVATTNLRIESNNRSILDESGSLRILFNVTAGFRLP